MNLEASSGTLPDVEFSGTVYLPESSFYPPYICFKTLSFMPFWGIVGIYDSEVWPVFDERIGKENTILRFDISFRVTRF